MFMTLVTDSVQLAKFLMAAAAKAVRSRRQGCEFKVARQIDSTTGQLSAYGSC